MLMSYRFQFFCKLFRSRMNKNISSKQLDKNLSSLQSSNNNENSRNKVSNKLLALKTKSSKNNILDYKDVSLSLAGEISSSNIQRKSLGQKPLPNVSFMDDAEDDDEQFILNMKESIDENRKMQNKENYSTHLQSQSYLKKKKSAFSLEDQNLIKKFKKSVDENKALCAISQQIESENIISTNNQTYSTTNETPQNFSADLPNNINMNLRSNTNQFFLHVDSKFQEHDQLVTPVSTTTIIENDIEQFYYKMQNLTPLKENNKITHY